MINSEFKAWFDGFTEAMDGVPNKKQWDRIKARVKEIDGAPITKLYVDRYWPRGYPYWGVTGPLYNYSANSCEGQVNVSDASQSFNSQNAMYALGHLEASN